MSIENPNQKPLAPDGAQETSESAGAVDRVGTRIWSAYGQSPGLIDHEAAGRSAHRFTHFAEHRAPLAAQIFSRWGTAGRSYAPMPALLYRASGVYRDAAGTESIGDAAFAAETPVGRERVHTNTIADTRKVALEPGRRADRFVRPTSGVSSVKVSRSPASPPVTREIPAPRRNTTRSHQLSGVAERLDAPITQDSARPPDPAGPGPMWTQRRRALEVPTTDGDRAVVMSSDTGLVASPTADGESVQPARSAVDVVSPEPMSVLRTGSVSGVAARAGASPLRSSPRASMSQASFIFRKVDAPIWSTVPWGGVVHNESIHPTQSPVHAAWPGSELRSLVRASRASAPAATSRYVARSPFIPVVARTAASAASITTGGWPIADAHQTQSHQSTAPLNVGPLATGHGVEPGTATSESARAVFAATATALSPLTLSVAQDVASPSSSSMRPASHVPATGNVFSHSVVARGAGDSAVLRHRGSVLHVPASFESATRTASEPTGEGGREPVSERQQLDAPLARSWTVLGHGRRGSGSQMEVTAPSLPLTRASQTVANSTVARTVAQEMPRSGSPGPSFEDHATLSRGAEHHTTRRASGSDADVLDIRSRATVTPAAAAHVSAFRGVMPTLVLRKLSSATVWPTGQVLSMSADPIARHSVGSPIISSVAPLAASPFRSKGHAWMSARAVRSAEAIARKTDAPAAGAPVWQPTVFAAASHLISRSAGSFADRVPAVDVPWQDVAGRARNLVRAMLETPAMSPAPPSSRNGGGDLDLAIPVRSREIHDQRDQPVIRRFTMPDDVHGRGELARATMTSVSELARQEASAPRRDTAAAFTVSPDPTTSTESTKGAGADIEDLVERVSRRLFRELAIERERRGSGSWLQ
jgi:hypothetical protein